jgi:Tat protein secretion system quality control protein TatD with DNase activity
MTVYVADAHANVQRLVSVVKMATVLEEFTTEEQRSILHFFCEQKDSMRRIFIKKYFLFMVGSVCRVKRFTIG